MPTKPAPSGKPAAAGKAAKPAPRKTQGERRDAMRQKLLDATLHTLATRGYAATSVSHVLARARVSRGAWNHHFPTMNALILESAQYLMAKVYIQLASLMSAWKTAGGRMHEMVRLTWREFFASEVNDVYLELLIASRRDAKLAEILRGVSKNIDRNLEATSQHFFEPVAGSVTSAADMLAFNRWMLRGLALDAHLIPQQRIDAYLESWSRLVATQMQARAQTTP